MQEKIPGPDGPANDNWGTDPRGKEAPRKRIITEDPRIVKAVD
ncbi:MULTISPECIES: hypothetical protein [Nocardia]|nr:MULTISPECIES: hypothetical protein [Nocardia]